MEKVALEPTPIYRNKIQRPTPPRDLVLSRPTLHQTLAQGPGHFLQRVRLLPYRHNGKFIGFQIQTLFPGENIRIDAPLIGDVILRVNGSRIDRPDQLQQVWESLYTANAITIEYWRQGLVFTTTFPISN